MCTDAQEFIQRGLCPDLSLGYHVTMSKSPAGFLRATNKKVVELSIVRQGARDGCKIRAFSDSASKAASKMAASMFGQEAEPSSSGKPGAAATAARHHPYAKAAAAATAAAKVGTHKILV